MEYLIKCKKTAQGYDITEALIVSDNGIEEKDVRYGFHYKTKRGWISKKRVIIDFPIIEQEEEDLYIISKEVVDFLISNYTGGKLFRLEYQEINGEEEDPFYIHSSGLCLSGLNR